MESIVLLTIYQDTSVTTISRLLKEIEGVEGGGMGKGGGVRGR